MPRYDITPTGYWRRFKRNIELHNNSQDRSYLFYAALELRFTIEAILFTYLFSVGGKPFTKSELKLYTAKSLKTAILRYDPLFQHKLDFVEMCHFYRHELRHFVKPDMNLLSDVYGNVGSYLHAQKKQLRRRIDDDRLFWSTFAKLLDSCGSHIAMILSSPFVTMSFTPLGDAVIEQYAKGQLSKTKVKEILARKWNLMFRSITEHSHEF